MVALAAGLTLFGTALPPAASALQAATALTAAGLDRSPCVLTVLPTATPVGTGACPGVRPGAFMIVPSRNAGCTMGFVFSDRYGRYYVSTAGHCVLDDGKQARWAEGRGPIVTDANRKAIGRFVFAAYRGNYDVGIILLTKGIVPKASMCHFGGPTGVTHTRSMSVVKLEHYGNGVGVSEILPARTGTASGMPDPYEVYALMAITMGDSGGPVITTSGRAVGWVTHIGFGVVVAGGVHTGPAIIHRLGPQITLAQKYLKRSLTLRKASHSAPLL